MDLSKVQVGDTVILHMIVESIENGGVFRGSTVGPDKSYGMRTYASPDRVHGVIPKPVVPKAGETWEAKTGNIGFGGERRIVAVDDKSVFYYVDDIPNGMLINNFMEKFSKKEM